MDLSETFTPFLKELTDASAQIIRRYFLQDSLQVETKGDQTPVTLADRESEEIMRKMINDRFPEHGIVGEEYGTEGGDREFVWVLDPVDGTRTFAAGVPLFGTLICLKHNGQPILGAINQPILNQLLIGNGETTWLNDKPVRVRPAPALEKSVLLTTDTRRFEKIKDGQRWDKLAKSVELYRTWGDCYGYLLVATGWADIMVDPIVAEWDFFPMIPIIRGAGGVITDYEGRDPVKGNSVIAAHPDLHQKVLGILHG